MQKVIKSITVICLALSFLMCCTVICTASQDCKLTVCLEDKEKNPINSLQIFICKIADFTGTDYLPATGLENSGISVSGILNDPSAANAKNVLSFVKENNISPLSATSTGGRAIFSPIDTGIWLVYCEDGGAYSFNPYFVFLPLAIDGKLNYEVTSTPKTEESTPNSKSIYVVKKWEDKNNAAKKRPDSITVYLKHDGNTVDTAVLNNGNGWSHTFSALSANGDYSVEEVTVEGYSAEYNGDSENGFVITNTYNGEKLPQTGQLWWPIAIISVAGIAFIVLGIIELRVKKDENKTK